MTIIFEVKPLPGEEVCDFCAHPHIFKTYAGRNFMYKKESIFPHESVGAWAACQECSRLIDAGRWSSLTERSLRRFVKKHHIPNDEVSALWCQLTDLHRLFKEHRSREA